MDPERYLARVGVDAGTVDRPDCETLARLQSAHVTTTPFETLSINGDPFDEQSGEGVSLALPDLYEKLVERRRGGFCFELNGLFGWLLRELGYDPDRVAAMVLDEDGAAHPPANHLTHVVELDRRYVVDVGMGTPTMRRPTPLDGTAVEDDVGVEWRAVESERPDADYLTQYRGPGEEAWNDRYVFRDRLREMEYFAATCEYLATAPESGFVGDPVVSIATDRGHAKLGPETLTRTVHGEERERSVDRAEWFETLQAEFGIEFGPS
jgi:N-hydroxyarylamine O-acetyltransferase